MTAATTIPADATGITKPRRGRGAGAAIDKMLEQPAPAENEQVVEIPIADIVEHPRNPKGRTSDVDDLVAGIKAIGVQSPLSVCTGAAYNAGRLDGDKEVDPAKYVIVGGGHRRRAAAKKAGLTTVPCFVRDHLADAKGRKAALFENLHRKQLGVFDEAEAFLELVDRYGVSQRALAADVGCTQPHVNKRLKLLQLPSQARTMCEVGKLPIVDALEFARIADQGPIFDKAWAKFNAYEWMTAKRAVSDAIADHEQSVKRQKALDVLQAANVYLLPNRPAYWPEGKTVPVQLDETGITEQQHATDACHAAYVSPEGVVVLACKEPGRHLKNGGSPLSMPPAKMKRFTEPRSATSSADKKRDAQRRALKKATPARRDFIRMLLVPLSIEGKDAEQLMDIAVVGHVFSRPGSGNDMARIILSIVEVDAGKVYASNVIDEIRDGRKIDPEIKTALPLLTAAAYLEAQLVSTYHKWGDDERWWLQLLQRYGYPLADIEVEMLAEIKPGPLESPPACRMCLKQPGPDDVWVAPDLCSACSDSIDHGWLAEQAEAQGVTVAELTEPIEQVG